MASSLRDDGISVERWSLSSIRPACRLLPTRGRRGQQPPKFTLPRDARWAMRRSLGRPSKSLWENREAILKASPGLPMAPEGFQELPKASQGKARKITGHQKVSVVVVASTLKLQLLGPSWGGPREGAPGSPKGRKIHRAPESVGCSCSFNIKIATFGPIVGGTPRRGHRRPPGVSTGGAHNAEHSRNGCRFSTTVRHLTVPGWLKCGAVANRTSIFDDSTALSRSGVA